MKKLSKIVFRELIQQDEILSKNAQKYIMGGYGGYDAGGYDAGGYGSGDKCCYSAYYTDSAQYPCANQADCIEKAGRYGWWGCNGSSVSC